MSTDRCYFFHMKLITFLRHLRKLFSSKESKETVVIYFVLKYTKFLLYHLSLNIFSRKSFWKIIISCSTSTVICCRNKNSGISFCCQRITACLPWIAHLSFMLFLRAFTKLQKASIISSRLFVRPSVRPSVSSHGTTRLQLDGFSWHLIFKNFLGNKLGNSHFLKIWQE